MVKSGTHKGRGDSTGGLRDRGAASTGEEPRVTIEELEISNAELRATLDRLREEITDLQSANADLKAQVAAHSAQTGLMSVAVANVQEGVLITAGGLEWPGSEILFANAALCEMTGHTPQELVGQKPQLLLGDTANRDCGEYLRAELQAGRSACCEVTTTRKDGSQLPVELTVAPVVSTDGRTTSFVSVHRDDSSRRRAEQDRAQLAAIVEWSEDAIIGKALDGTIESWNAAAERIFGYSRAEALGQSAAMLVPPEHQAEFRSVLDRVVRGEHVGHIETVRQCKAGETIHVSHSVSPVCDNSGQIVGASAISRDITERKLAEAALHDREERLRAVLDTATDAIITIDRDGIIQGVNPATSQMFGYGQDELVGRNVTMLMPPPYCDEHEDYIARYLQTGEARIIGTGREVSARRKNGTTFPVDVAVSEIDHLGIFTGIIRDISERKRLEHEVLDIAANEQRRIGQGLHDELGQHLGGLGMTADALAKRLARQQNATEADMARGIQQGLKEAGALVRTLAYGLVPVDVASHSLADALNGLAARFHEREGLDCTFDCPDDVNVEDNQTATHLFRIAQEAATNAIRHGSPSHIRITLVKQNDLGILTIRDDGTGYRASPPDQTEGVGLRSMRYRADQIGARLDVQSSPGEGTTVTCTIPLEPVR